jgi:hypothetical protein
LSGCNLVWGSWQSWPIKIDIQMSRSVKINFFKVSRFSQQLRPAFFFSVKIFKIKTFQSRLGCINIFIKTVEIFKICWDFWDLLRLFKIYWDISTLSRLFEILQDQRSWQISTEKYDKIDQLSIEIKTNCRDLPKMSCLDRFLDLDQDFWDWKVVLRQNWDFLILMETSFWELSRFSRLSRPTLCQCQDRESWSRHNWDKSRPPG